MVVNRKEIEFEPINIIIENDTDFRILTGILEDSCTTYDHGSVEQILLVTLINELDAVL